MRQICVRFASDNYDPWAELYWKKQIEGKLTEEEQKELEKLEKEIIDVKTKFIAR